MRCGSEAPPRASRTFSSLGLDDGADIHAVVLADAGIGDAPAPVLALPQLGEALIAAQRIAAGRDEGDDVVEVLAVEPGIGRGRVDLVDRARRRGTASAQAMPRTCWASTSSAPVRGVGRVLRARHRRHRAPPAFQHLEAVGGHQQGLGRLVQPVVGAADALHQPRSRPWARRH